MKLAMNKTHEKPKLERRERLSSITAVVVVSVINGS